AVRFAPASSVRRALRAGWFCAPCASRRLVLCAVRFAPASSVRRALRAGWFCAPCASRRLARCAVRFAPAIMAAMPSRAGDASSRISPVVLVLATLAGLGLRLWLAAGHYGNYDQTSFQAVSGIVARGGNVYAETSRYNYSPVWAHILALLAAFAGRA